MSAFRKTVAIDFDGVLHAYSRGWEEGVIYDEPMPGAAAAVAELARHYRLVVFTARNCEKWGTPIHDWLERHGMAEHIAEVTNLKPPAAFYVDDRAIRFTSWDQALAAVATLAPNDGWRPL